jgi:hypothetical protein
LEIERAIALSIFYGRDGCLTSGEAQSFSLKKTMSI